MCREAGARLLERHGKLYGLAQCALVPLAMRREAPQLQQHVQHFTQKGLLVALHASVTAPLLVHTAWTIVTGCL